jgi:hypothetical protein
MSDHWKKVGEPAIENPLVSLENIVGSLIGREPEHTYYVENTETGQTGKVYATEDGIGDQIARGNVYLDP